jgi:hypothetical protein
MLGHGPHGKPFLDPQHHEGWVRFNMSHSHELALVAVSRERELGIDVEHVRPIQDIDEIAVLTFGTEARAAFGRASSPARLWTFYRHWTLKEAHLKACGIGISRVRDAADVTGPWISRSAFPASLAGGSTRLGPEEVSIRPLGTRPRSSSRAYVRPQSPGSSRGRDALDAARLTTYSLGPVRRRRVT